MTKPKIQSLHTWSDEQIAKTPIKVLTTLALGEDDHRYLPQVVLSASEFAYESSNNIDIESNIARLQRYNMDPDNTSLSELSGQQLVEEYGDDVTKFLRNEYSPLADDWPVRVEGSYDFYRHDNSDDARKMKFRHYLTRLHIEEISNYVNGKAIKADRKYNDDMKKTRLAINDIITADEEEPEIEPNNFDFSSEFTKVDECNIVHTLRKEYDYPVQALINRPVSEKIAWGLVSILAWSLMIGASGIIWGILTYLLFLYVVLPFMGPIANVIQRGIGNKQTDATDEEDV